MTTNRKTYRTSRHGEDRDPTRIEAQFIQKWRFVIVSCAYFGVGAGVVIAAAVEAGLGPSDVAPAFTRTFAYLREHGTLDGAAFEEFDAVPPGMLDVRIVLQDELWVDVLGRRRRVSDLCAGECAAIVDALEGISSELHAQLGTGADASAWLKATPMMRALMRSVL